MTKSIKGFHHLTPVYHNSVRRFIGILLTALLLFPLQTTVMAQNWTPNWDSIMQHETPEWFRDAKFGIFIHWGVYSVPAWAPRGMYAEWDPTYMYKKDHPVSEYHREVWGEEFQYEDFIPLWKAENWDPEAWADLFVRAGDEIRFTWKEDTLYLFLMNEPHSDRITIPDLFPDEKAEIALLASSESLEWTLTDNHLTILLPETLPGEYVYVLSISGDPGYLMRRSR